MVFMCAFVVLHFGGADRTGYQISVQGAGESFGHLALSGRAMGQ